MFGLVKKRRRKATRFEFEPAPEVKIMVDRLVAQLDYNHINPHNIYCVRSSGSAVRAYARIWGLSRIFQETAGYPPTYVIEVNSRYFDKLPADEQIKVLIHELMHIPKTFSGALKSHRGPHHAINNREVEKIYKKAGL